MMIFEKIKQEIMADPMNEAYTERGYPRYSKLLSMPELL